MKLESVLKNLQHIEADRGYTKRSRNLILSSGLPTFSFQNSWQVALRALQSGSAIALAGLLLVLTLGGFSAWQFLSPFQISSLDPASLKAEAQAIDIQVQLTQVSYYEPLPSEGVTSSIPVALRLEASAIKREAEAQAQNLGLKTATSSPSEPSIDETLERLGE
ncbi:MAG: hypothetical protein A3A43_03150 [Candidatus Liptonbacteria bacterium RIFCSPLOWO2_01_FULL_56_20]|uniref:Uncharacterized protein n=1 Tax=Candidatus Liptonbacteria bacterium RIFCSPLOWO2_01_FULL_56_20 TaxID=1798652 RepID=A0A1G2CGW5_9BACT|nr:MAG: hypothetical protein UY96_C0026G0005 [Parcubacteria group bacterium GW2011_GWB1_56_8]OGZ00626.1 MAG: hypothetical protein A3A43_03150 [Candidatus Liptonbacteria bacterium RIFCSPLOWO2_01_FULL_56_20]